MKTRSPYAIRLRTPPIQIPTGAAFRDVVEALRSDPSFGQRVSRHHHAGLTKKRAMHVEGNTREDLDAVLTENYQKKEEAILCILALRGPRAR